MRVLHRDSSLPAGEGTDVFHSSIDTEAGAERQLQELIDTGRNEHISPKRAFDLALVYQQRHDEMFTTGLYRCAACATYSALLSLVLYAPATSSPCCCVHCISHAAAATLSRLVQSWWQGLSV